MLIFWEQRLVLLATPKTGSTALAAALEGHATLAVQRPPVLKHTPSQRYHRFIGPWLEASSGSSFTTVALMREPVDWLASWYRFRHREDLRGAPTSTQGLSFDDFILAYCSSPQPPCARVGAQARFLTPPRKPPVDRIFRYEDMPAFLAFLEARLSCRLDLPRINLSPPVAAQASPTAAARLRACYPEDFRLYDRLSG